MPAIKPLLILALTALSTASPLYLPIPKNTTLAEALAIEKASLPHLTIVTTPSTPLSTPTPPPVHEEHFSFPRVPVILLSHHTRRGPIADSLPQKTLSSLALLSTRIKALTSSVKDYDSSAPKSAYAIENALQSLHHASLQTNDDALLLAPLSQEDSTKMIEYIRENIVVDVMESVKAMKEKEEDFKKAKLHKIVVVVLKSLREDYDRPSMVLAKKIQKRDLGAARELLKGVDEAIKEGIKEFEED
ncbi:hypothetical protein HYFRA_00000100 [Hymenoscyphus fraxineus]|uniref:Cell wall protein n=1 Tax=Hymenoscyphus fraxineus TaxID=746836 RepID=A0A9N9L693_9HELO|nr:hypothetical protein HYFRA_00000100 [Hymenoscyphus fraxineus]